MAYTQSPGGAAPQKASKTGIIWAIAIFAVTAIVGIVMIAISIGTIANAINDLETIDAGETRTIDLGNGDYYVFAGTETGNRFDVARMAIDVIDPSGDPVTVGGGGNYTSDTDNSYFESIGHFEVSGSGTNRPGEYTVTVTGPQGTTARLGEIPIARFLGLLFGGIAIGFIGFVVALTILIVALVRRSRVKKANRALEGGYGGPGGPPAPYGAPGYGQPTPPPPYGQPPAPQPYGQPPAPAPTPPPPAPSAPPAPAAEPPPAWPAPAPAPTPPPSSSPPAPTPPPTSSPPAPTPPPPTPPPAPPG